MMSADDAFNNQRLLLIYKGDISALILFAQRTDGSICFPQALPALSSALEPEEYIDNKVSPHPSTLINRVNHLMNLDNDLLRIEQGFSEQIDTPGGIITVHMARFVLLDPPHQLIQKHGCFLRTLPELRGRPPAEMELLRRAYVHLMEG